MLPFVYELIKKWKSLISLKKVFFFLVFFLLVLIVFLFRDSYYDGMNFDEVFRVNDLIPFVNKEAKYYNHSIFDLKIFGLKVPLVYKVYGSYFGLVFSFPIFLFRDYRFGLRFFHLFYFAFSILFSLFVLLKFNFKS